jgi:hypothetical protein
MRCTLRRKTAGVAEATLRFVDNERTAQTREDGVLNSSVVPKKSGQQGDAVRFSRQ